jgi:S-DNA-T family DNA segregation ATPase FtsK/SpoIIIE
MGAAKTGKKNYMKAMIASALEKKSQVALIDGTGLMKQYALQENISYIANDEELFQYFQTQLSPEFMKRNSIKKRLLESGYEEEELYTYTRKETPVFIFISDFMWLIRVIYDTQNIQKNMKGFMETLTQKGRYHNIYFIGILNMEDKNAVKAYQMYSNFASYKTGIHFGGNVTQNGLFDFSYLSFKDQAKIEKPGIGMLPETGSEDPTQKIVVPLVGNIHRKEVMEI